MRDLRLAAERQRDTHNRDVRLAYMVAYFTRAKRPSMERLIIGEKPPQTVDEQLQVLKVLSKRFGGQVQTVTGHG